MDLQHVQEFLIDLKFNNNRNWFDENKPRYQKALKTFQQLISEVIDEIQEFDNELNTTAKESIFRIYRDVRFSGNKEPYKTNFGAYMVRDGKKSPFAGYYLHYEPDHSFLGGGIYRPDNKVLHAVRSAIYDDATPFKIILNEPGFAKNFKLSEEEKLKTAPKGFSKDFEDISLLNYKHYAPLQPLNNDFWEQRNLVKEIAERFRKIHPFNDYLNSIIEKS